MRRLPGWRLLAACAALACALALAPLQSVHAAADPPTAQSQAIAALGYDFRVIARTGATFNFPIHGTETLTSFGGGPSINDFGDVAFTAVHQNGTAVLVGDGGLHPLRNPTGHYGDNPDRNFQPFVGIDNARHVVAVDRYAGGTIGLVSYVRTWDGGYNPDQNNPVHENISVGGNPVDKDWDLVSAATIADPPTVPVGPPEPDPIGSAGNNGVNWSVVIGRRPSFNARIGGNYRGALRPYVTTDKTIVYRADTSTVDPTQFPIVLADRNGTQTQIACGSGCADPGFTELGQAPSATDDSRVVAFEGRQGATRGIWLSIARAGTPRLLRNIAAIGDSNIDDFDTTLRVAIQSSYTATRVATVAYVASAGGVRGMYVTRVHFVGNANGTIDWGTVQGVRADPPELVAQVGTNVPTVGSIDDFSWYDPLNNRSRGDLAFWMKSGTTEAIVRARPLCDGRYRTGHRHESEYINQYAAGAAIPLPASSGGTPGGASCGPSALTMAIDNALQAKALTASKAGLADEDTDMVSLLAADTATKDASRNFDVGLARTHLAALGWTIANSDIRWGGTNALPWIDDRLAEGKQVIASTRFGHAAQTIDGVGTYASGHVILIRGKLPSGDYVVEDAAGDFASNPENLTTRPHHYGSGVCGDNVVYPANLLRNNLFNAAGTAGRWAMAIPYDAKPDPEVLLVVAHAPAGTARPYRVWLEDAAGRRTGFLPDGSQPGEIPQSDGFVSPIENSDLDNDAAPEISPDAYPYEVMVAQPGDGLTVHVSGDQSTDYDVELVRMTGDEVDSVSHATGHVDAGATATVRATRPPTALPQSVRPVLETPKTIVLHATDRENDPLTYAIGTQPQHGTLSAVAGDDVVYTPAPGYLGPDSFTFTANDGAFDSKPATVSITVKQNDPPTATIVPPGSTVEGAPLEVRAVGVDPDDEPLTYAWTATGGTVTGTGPTASFTGLEGPFDAVVTVTATDPHGAIARASTVVHVGNSPPTATFDIGSSDEASPFTLGLSGASDPSPTDTAAGFAYAFDCGSGYGPFAPTAAASCPTADSGSPAVGAQIRDRDGGVREYRGVATVRNVAPAVQASGGSAAWGLPASLSGSATDVSAPDVAAGLAPSWSFGDSTPPAAGFAVSHVYANAGSFTATLSVTDKDGGVGTASVPVSVGKRNATLAYSGSTTAAYGFARLSAHFGDATDVPTGQPGGRRVTFTAGSLAFAANTDDAGNAVPVLTTPIGVGTYSVVARFAADARYDAVNAPAATLKVTSSAGSASGTGLQTANGVAASFSVSSTDGSTIRGSLSYGTLSTTMLAPFGIAPDGHSAWFNGVTLSGQKLVVYVEDNGPGGDVFKLWQNGVLQTGAGNLAAGDVVVSR